MQSLLWFNSLFNCNRKFHIRSRIKIAIVLLSLIRLSWLMSSSFAHDYLNGNVLLLPLISRRKKPKHIQHQTYTTIKLNFNNCCCIYWFIANKYYRFWLQRFIPLRQPCDNLRQSEKYPKPDPHQKRVYNKSSASLINASLIKWTSALRHKKKRKIIFSQRNPWINTWTNLWIIL